MGKEVKEDLLKKGVDIGGRRMEEISPNDILDAGVVTSAYMENACLPFVLHADAPKHMRIKDCKPVVPPVMLKDGEG